jgi:RND family efflux transporter MFP subunit
MGTRRTLIKILLPAVVLMVGAFVMVSLIKNRPVPQKTARPNLGALVQFVTVEKQDRQIQVHSTGTVQPEQEVSITMQVSGRIDRVSPGFVAGGFFRAGELLFSVESVDYELAVERAKAALIRAENEIIIVESKAEVAREEWKRLKLGSQEEPNPLIVYGPQLQDAKASRTAAAAALKQAELDLKRTQVVAPFNCLVRMEEVGLGKYVRIGNNVAMVASIDAAEIIVPLTLDDLQWLKIPGQRNADAGSLATITVEAGSKMNNWQGHLVRSLGEIDPRSRMSRVVVRVDDPYQKRKESKQSRINLEMGMFVEVSLHGQTLKDIVELPRTAVRENSSVWLMDSENKLRIQAVEIMRLEKETALIKSGLKGGENIILTALPGAVDGMKLRPAQEGESR